MTHPDFHAYADSLAGQVHGLTEIQKREAFALAVELEKGVRVMDSTAEHLEDITAVAEILQAAGSSTLKFEELSKDQAGLLVVCDSLLERLARVDQEYRKVADFTDRRIAMVRSSSEEKLARLNQSATHFRTQLEILFPMMELGKKKSMALPHGTVGTQATKDKIIIHDADTVLGFAQETDGVEVTVTHKVGKTTLMDWVKENGEAPTEEVHGFTVDPAGRSFYVKPVILADGD